MRQALHNLNRDLAQDAEKQGSAFVARVTSDEGDIGRGHLSRFQDPEEHYPVILTTSQLLTTGVDAPTCKNVALVRVIGSMSEFKQIIGRGTRVREDKGKLFFHILDYTGSATQKFADPDFDGDPVKATIEAIDEDGQTVDATRSTERDDRPTGVPLDDDDPSLPRKFYLHGGPVEIATEVTMDLDADGQKLRTVEIRQYVGAAVRTLYTDPDDLRRKWGDFEQRSTVVEQLAERGIAFHELAELAGTPDADVFDLLCHVAFNAPLRTRRERAERLRKEKQDFFGQYGPEARAILAALLDKYAEHGTSQLNIPDALEVPPISAYGNIVEIAGKFGGTDKLLAAVGRMHELLYAA